MLCMQNSNNSWCLNSNEGNILHNLHNGGWVGWMCWWDFKVEAIDILSLEKFLLSEDWKGSWRSNGSRDLWFQYRRTSDTTLFLTWPCVCCGHTISSSIHHSVLWLRICRLPPSGKSWLMTCFCFCTFSYCFHKLATYTQKFLYDYLLYNST